MSKEYRTSRRVRGAFAIQEEHIRRLQKLVSDAVGKPASVRVEIADVYQVDTTDLDDILDDPRLQSSHLTSISISGYNYEEFNRISASISVKKFFLGPISIDITAPRDKSITLEHDMLSAVKSMKLWYSRAYQHLELVTFVILMPLAAAVSAMVYLGGEFHELVKTLLFLFGIASYTLVLMWLGRFLFPELIIEIGHGLKISRVRTKIISFIGTGIILAALIGVISNYVFGWIPANWKP